MSEVMDDRQEKLQAEFEHFLNGLVEQGLVSRDGTSERLTTYGLQMLGTLLNVVTADFAATAQELYDNHSVSLDTFMRVANIAQWSAETELMITDFYVDSFRALDEAEGVSD